MRPALSLRRAFTIVELLMVCAIIALLAALSIPNLVASKLKANETSAIAKLKKIHAAQFSFKNSDLDNDGKGNFGNMQALITAGQIDFGNGTNAPFNSDGYAFECEPSSDPSQVNYAFVATANPINPGSTGERNFVMDINGLVHFKTGEEILAASLQPACEVPPGCSVAGN